MSKWSASVCGEKSHGRSYSVGGRTLLTESSYPSGGRASGDGYSGTMSSGGGVGSSYVATNHDLRIRNVYKALADGEEWKPGAYCGCQGDNSRKNKETDGLSSPLKYVINEIKIYSGFHPVKGFVFSDCNLTARDMEYLSGNLPSINHTFELVDFSYNPQIGPLGLDHLIKGAPGIVSLQSGNHDINLMYQGMLTRPGFNTVKLDLSNCNIGDIGADILGHALISGKLPATKEIDVSGNQITDNGAQSFADALREGMPTFLQNLKIFGNNLTATGEKALALAVKYSPNEMMAVTLDRVKSSGALDFIKKAFNYYAQEHYENHQAASKAAVAIYGNDDWTHCKKLIADGSRELLSGVIKNSANPLAAQVLQKAPLPVKEFTIGGIFVVSTIETVGAVDIESLGYCIAAVNKEVASHLNLNFDPNLPENSVGFIGQNEEIVDEWH